MRVIFFGTAPFAVPSLERVATRHAVVMCVTQPDRPRGRGLVRGPSAVKQAAGRLGLPVSQPERPTAQPVEPLRADVGVVVAYGQVIRSDVLRVPLQGFLGVHPSLLPSYRGAAPVAWALLNGETTTGVTIFRLDERLDAGDIVVQQSVPIEPQDDAEALTARLAQRGADALVQALEAIGTGTATFTPQDDAQATLAPKLTKSQGRIDWTAPAEMIARLVRATMPWPGASTIWGGTPLRIWAVSQEATVPSTGSAPGTVVEVGSDRVLVATGRGGIGLLEVQPAGRRRMRMREFLAGHPMAVGDRLGTTRTGA